MCIIKYFFCIKCQKGRDIPKLPKQCAYYGCYHSVIDYLCYNRRCLRRDLVPWPVDVFDRTNPYTGKCDSCDDSATCRIKWHFVGCPQHRQRPTFRPSFKIAPENLKIINTPDVETLYVETL